MAESAPAGQGSFHFPQDTSTPRLPDASRNERQDRAHRAFLREAIRSRLAEAAERAKPKVVVPARFESRARLGNLGWMEGTPTGKNAVAHARQFAEAQLAGEIFDVRGPLVMGPTGVGKTHLLWATARELAEGAAAAIARARAEKEAEMLLRIQEGDASLDFRCQWPKVSVLVSGGAELAQELRSSVATGRVEQVVDKYRQSDAVRDRRRAVLLLDDIQVLKMSDWLGPELYRIFDYRYAHGLPTMMATNFRPAEIQSHFGDLIARRILELTEPFVIG